MFDRRRWSLTGEATGERLSPPPRGTLPLVAGAAILSIALGAAVGNPNPTGHLILGVILAVGIQCSIVFLPRVSFLGVCGTLFFLVCWAINDHQYLNLFDIVLPALFTLSMWGGKRAAAIEEDARLTGERHAELFRTTRQLQRAAVIFNALAVLSLITIGVKSGWDAVVQVGLFEVRMIYGILVFPLALWLLRTERHIYQAINVVAFVGLAAVIVNLYQITTMELPRAGMTWVINHPEWFMEDPNMMGSGISVVCAFIMVRQRSKPAFWTYPLIGILLVLLGLTESRSGTLSTLIVLALSARSFRLRHVVTMLVLLAVAALMAPVGFWDKMISSVLMSKGTFHLHSILIRFYGYQSAMRVFMDNWLIGVGYVGCQFVSHQYNDLNITDLGAENFFLEIAAGLGVIGLVAVARWYWTAFQIGRVARRVAPPGTLGSAFADLYFPLFAGLTVANLTGDNFIGFVGVGQFALYIALMIRATHLGIEREASPAGAAS